MSKGEHLPDGVQKAESARIPAAGRLALAATWEAKEGDGDAVADILRRMTNEVKTEPGTLCSGRTARRQTTSSSSMSCSPNDATISGGLNREEVRFWPKVDLSSAAMNFRSRGKSGHPLNVGEYLHLTHFRHPNYSSRETITILLPRTLLPTEHS
jgi:hypothetical protein